MISLFYCKTTLGRTERRWTNNTEADVKEAVRKCGMDIAGKGNGPVARFYEFHDDSFGFIRITETFNELSDYHLLKEDSAP
jgi:hypothetical protein